MQKFMVIPSTNGESILETTEIESVCFNLGEEQEEDKTIVSYRAKGSEYTWYGKDAKGAYDLIKKILMAIGLFCAALVLL